MGYEDGRPSQEAWEKAYREACSMPVRLLDCLVSVNFHKQDFTVTVCR